MDVLPISDSEEKQQIISHTCHHFGVGVWVEFQALIRVLNKRPSPCSF